MVLILVATLALQAEPLSSGAPAKDVVVTAPRRSQPLQDRVDRFVAAVGQPSGYDQLARWRSNDPICVRTANFKPEAASAIRRTIESEARRLNLQVGGDVCTANVIVVGTDDPPKTMEAIQRKAGPLWDEAEGPAAMMREISKPAPVHWWRVTRTDPARGCAPVSAGDGGPPVFNSFGVSHLQKQTREDVQGVVVLVDSRKLGEVAAGPLAAYVAMGIFAAIPSPPRSIAAPSILALFKPEGGVEGGAPDSLTDWDLAYLDGLYKSDPSENADLQNGQIQASMTRTLDAGAPPAKR